MQFKLKKPKGLPARVFAGRIVQMNNYIEFLPCLHYSARATNTTELATKMSEPALAQLLLRLVPQKWQHSYNILNKGIPQSMEEILVFLEGQEMLMSEVAYPISQKITNLMASAKGALIMVVVAVRKVRNTVISVQRMMGRRIPTTLVSAVHTILTEVGSIRVSPMETRRRRRTSPSS